MNLKQLLNQLIDRQLIADLVTQYVETRVELTKLDFQERIATLIILLLEVFVIAIIMLSLWLLISVGLALLINHWWFPDTPFAGFLCIAGVQGLFLMMLWLIRQRLHNQLEYKIYDEINKDEERKRARRKSLRS
ncbi:phage holin family protein [Eisenibacter elegans]|jgi:uncharacterized membrane protein YqjE|uniref:phage holin family protein n=1 Tax=Eisenibacter elegans TaxID=997 RepID=UPI0003F50428|nr:phage holin family protein [Eisenibacter elegans]